MRMGGSRRGPLAATAALLVLLAAVAPEAAGLRNSTKDGPSTSSSTSTNSDAKGRRSSDNGFQLDGFEAPTRPWLEGSGEIGRAFSNLLGDINANAASAHRERVGSPPVTAPC
jgi:hypothetical protein